MASESWLEGYFHTAAKIQVQFMKTMRESVVTGSSKQAASCGRDPWWRCTQVFYLKLYATDNLSEAECHPTLSLCYALKQKSETSLEVPEWAEASFSCGINAVSRWKTNLPADCHSIPREKDQDQHCSISQTECCSRETNFKLWLKANPLSMLPMNTDMEENLGIRPSYCSHREARHLVQASELTLWWAVKRCPHIHGKRHVLGKCVLLRHPLLLWVHKCSDFLIYING